MTDNDDTTLRAVGIDGCSAGWIMATTRAVLVCSRLQLDEFDLVGIDIPIGLVDGPPRDCDGAARKFLGSAGSSVFPAPPRAALAHTDYRSALDAARAATGRGISKQTFNIMAKVGEVDRLIRSTDDASTRQRIIEVHPECSFKLLNGDACLPSKKSNEGREVRRRLLADHFDVPPRAPKGAAIDDMLDAFAVLWSVERFRRGEHRVFGDGQRDDHGIEMRIVC